MFQLPICSIPTTNSALNAASPEEPPSSDPTFSDMQSYSLFSSSPLFQASTPSPLLTPVPQSLTSLAAVPVLSRSSSRARQEEGVCLGAAFLGPAAWRWQCPTSPAACADDSLPTFSSLLDLGGPRSHGHTHSHTPLRDISLRDTPASAPPSPSDLAQLREWAPGAWALPMATRTATVPAAETAWAAWPHHELCGGLLTETSPHVGARPALVDLLTPSSLLRRASDKNNHSGGNESGDAHTISTNSQSHSAGLAPTVFPAMPAELIDDDYQRGFAPALTVAAQTLRANATPFVPGASCAWPEEGEVAWAWASASGSWARPRRGWPVLPARVYAAGEVVEPRGTTVNLRARAWEDIIGEGVLTSALSDASVGVGCGSQGVFSRPSTPPPRRPLLRAGAAAWTSPLRGMESSTSGSASTATLVHAVVLPATTPAYTTQARSHPSRRPSIVGVVACAPTPAYSSFGSACATAAMCPLESTQLVRVGTGKDTDGERRQRRRRKRRKACVDVVLCVEGNGSVCARMRVVAGAPLDERAGRPLFYAVAADISNDWRAWGSADAGTVVTFARTNAWI